MSGRRNLAPVIPPALAPRLSRDGRAGVEIGPYFFTPDEARSYAAAIVAMADTADVRP